QVFDDQILQSLPGQMAVGHNRYSTTGSSHVCNAQPAIVPTRLGNLALAHNGNLVNASDLREELLRRRHDLNTTTDSEMIAFALAEAVNDGDDWVAAAHQAFNRCQGAFSLVIGTPEGLMATRDHQGIRPLVLGVLGPLPE
ncbi:MAG: amidophosphoribosyltransferase, partial [Nodosilinea sp.]